MKKNMIFFCVAFSLLLTSCDLLEKFPAYENEKMYHVIEKDGETFTDDIKKIDVSWVSGNITITSSKSYTELTVIEKVADFYDDEFLCHIYSANDFLNIKYCHSNISLIKNLNKDLFIYIPESMALDELIIKNVSSAVSIASINCKKVEIESVSGDVSLNKINAEDLLFESVSSSFTATLLPQTKNIEIDQVSGDVMLTMPKDNEGFVLEFDSISGDLISDFDTRRIDGKIVCGSLQTAQLDIEFSSVSGDLSLLKYVSKEM